jgi:hypothetical protein
MKTFLVRIATGTTLISSVLGFGALASANHAWTNGAGEPFHWARTTPSFTLKLGDNVTPAWDSYLATASYDWSLSSVLDTIIAPGLTNNTRGTKTSKQCSPASGRGEICNSKYGANGWLGITTIWASGTHITAGTVKMNDTYFTTATYNTPAWKNLVMCQEVGHIFGLNHQDENFNNTNLDTCMDYTNNPTTNQHPNVHDYAMLEEIYANLDLITTVSQISPSTGSGQLAEDSENPADWGQEVRRSLNGRASLFVQDFDDGNKVFRHVFWAEPRGGHRTE